MPDEIKPLPLTGGRAQSSEANRLAALAGIAEGSPDWRILHIMVVDRECARQQLDSQLIALLRDVVRVRETIRNPKAIMNDLGELQQRPAAVEAAVGALSAHSQALAVFLELHSVTRGAR